MPARPPARDRKTGATAGTALAEPASVPRFLLAAVLAAAGCGTGNYHYGYANGHCANPSAGDVAWLLTDLAFSGLQAGATLTETMKELPPPPSEPPPRRPVQRLFGTVTSATGQRVPFVMVTLRGPQDVVELETRADVGGRFWFPWPLPAGWYRISAGDQDVTGETKVWLADRRPAILDVVTHPKEPPPPMD
jgi:hypothetical protein